MHCAGALPARSKGSAGVMVAVALRHGLATPHGGVGDRGIELCRGRVLAFYHSGSVPGGALILSAYTHTRAGLTQELANSQHDWPVAYLPGSAVHHRWQPTQLERGGWARAIGGFVVAPQLATVTPSHRASISSLPPEILQARVKQPRKSPDTSRLTGPSELLCPRGSFNPTSGS